MKNIEKKFINFIANKHSERLQEFKTYNQIPKNFDETRTPLSYALSFKYNFSDRVKESFHLINSYLTTVITKIIILTCGKNWRRRIPFLPESYFFCDVAGSKYGSKIHYDENNIPHHHGTMLVHPFHQASWDEEELPSLITSISDMDFIQTVDIEPLKTQKDRYKWASYAAKVYLKNMDDVQKSDNSFLMFKGNMAS